MTTNANIHNIATAPQNTVGAEGSSTRKKTIARRRIRMRVLTLSFAVLLVASAIIAAWPRPLPVEEAFVRMAPLEVTVAESGKARVRDRYVVHAPLGGDLARIALRAGDSVARGAPLASIVPASPSLLDPRARIEATARVRAAEANAAQATAQVARAEVAFQHSAQDFETSRRLLSSGSVPPEQVRHDELEARIREQELAATRFGAKVAINDVEVARAALLRYKDQGPSHELFAIASPVSGRVLRVVQESAGIVAPGTSLLELGDPSSLEVVVDVLTSDAVRIVPNASVRLERWGGDRPLEGHVRIVEPSAFTKISALGVEEQRVSVLIDIDDPRDIWERLGDGYRVEARIVVWRSDGVLVVPGSAIFRHGEEWATFVEVDGRAHLRNVSIGQRGSVDVQVLSGLMPGDHVVVHPSSALSDGARIRQQ